MVNLGCCNNTLLLGKTCLMIFTIGLCHRARVRNLFTTTGRIICTLSLAGRKMNWFYPEILPFTKLWEKVTSHDLLSKQWYDRIIFVESESSHKHLKFFRVESESWFGRVESNSSHQNCRIASSHWLASLSPCRVTRNLTFSPGHFCYEMAPIMP